MSASQPNTEQTAQSQLSAFRRRLVTSLEVALAHARAIDQPLPPAYRQEASAGGDRPMNIGSQSNLALLSDLDAVAREAADALDRVVVLARAQGATWREIGEALGISHQSAHQRWRAHDPEIQRTTDVE